MMSVPFLTCMAMVANFYNLPPRVLPSIQAVEGGQVGIVSHNADGSDDLGVMQVNTRWIEPVARHTRQSQQIVRVRLIDDGCFNIAVAGAIMRSYLNEARGDLMLAVGYYHSHSPARNLAYQSSVLTSATHLFASRQDPNR
jgi:hypothetical protein